MRRSPMYIVLLIMLSACNMIPPQSGPPIQPSVSPIVAFPPTWTPLPPLGSQVPISPTSIVTPSVIEGSTQDSSRAVSLLASPTPANYVPYAEKDDITAMQATPNAMADSEPPLLAYTMDGGEGKWVVWVYDPSTDAIVLRSDADRIAWSSTGRYLAIGHHWDGKIVRLLLWDSQTHELREVPLEKFEATRGFAGFLWSSDDQYLAIESSVFGGTWGCNHWVDVIAGDGSGDSLMRLGEPGGWYGHAGNCGGIYLGGWLPDNKLYTRELHSGQIVRSQLTDVPHRQAIMRGVGLDLLPDVKQPGWAGSPPPQVLSPDGRYLASRTYDRALGPTAHVLEVHRSKIVRLPLPDGARSVMDLVWQP